MNRNHEFIERVKWVYENNLLDEHSKEGWRPVVNETSELVEFPYAEHPYYKFILCEKKV